MSNEFDNEYTELTSHINSERSIFRGAPFSIYKTTGACQFKLILPSQNKQQRIVSPGSILLEMAKCVGKKGKNNSYDWSNKISAKLMPIEISKLSICLTNNEEVSFVHNVSFSSQNKDVTKGGDVYKKINLNKGKQDNTMFLALSFQSNSIFISINRDESILLSAILRSSIPIIYGWYS